MDGRVVVIGSINFDVITRADRLPVAGETLIGADLQLSAGGKGANQAVAAKRLGAPTSLLAAVGTDVFANELVSFLEREEIVLNISVKTGEHSGLAQVLVTGDGQNSVVVASGANAMLSVDDIARFSITDHDVVLLQNEIPLDTSESVVRRARSANATVILNLAPYGPVGQDVLAAVDYLVVNEWEFSQMCERGAPVSVEEIPELLAEQRGLCRNTIVTMGPYGAIADLNGAVCYVGGHIVPVRDTTGAGDCFCGAFAVGLVSGWTGRQAVEFANAAAAVSVQAPGTTVSMPYLDDCHRLLNRENGQGQMRHITF